ncbi:sigma-70 family RNA polymerase sigma factor [Pedobacter sp. HDW13]|uniref:sigma-70 family RNA polymerase sigma factor n=1 Tax=Pedobacter sp. HDW13 TaxID=2714940 RepID=UPI00140E3C40|nr:sigma-70 family RNA polymerase sigma factor [Pedobacter sp. HDW13]QIL41650.1 sigma-70 family RNA polymerase sigma factor [Pedobacter sp. HDW13]
MMFFFYIWTKRGTLLINKSFSVYLYACLKHKIIDEVRKQNHRAKQSVLLRASLSESGNSTIEHVISKDLACQIKRKVNLLPEKMKAVYRLSREEELTVEEISTRLSLSSQTVKNQISSALKRLRISVYCD